MCGDEDMKIIPVISLLWHLVFIRAVEASVLILPMSTDVCVVGYWYRSLLAVVVCDVLTFFQPRKGQIDVHVDKNSKFKLSDKVSKS